MVKARQSTYHIDVAANIVGVESSLIRQWVERYQMPVVRTEGQPIRIPVKVLPALHSLAVGREPCRRCWDTKRVVGGPCPVCSTKED